MEEDLTISVQNVTANSIEFVVSPEAAKPRMIVLNVNKSFIQGDNIIVFPDGKVISRVSLTVLGIASNNASFSVVGRGNTYQIVTYIPHFSKHTIQITATETSSL